MSAAVAAGWVCRAGVLTRVRVRVGSCTSSSSSASLRVAAGVQEYGKFAEEGALRRGKSYSRKAAGGGVRAAAAEDREDGGASWRIKERSGSRPQQGAGYPGRASEDRYNDSGVSEWKQRGGGSKFGGQRSDGDRRGAGGYSNNTSRPERWQQQQQGDRRFSVQKPGAKPRWQDRDTRDGVDAPAERRVRTFSIAERTDRQSRKGYPDAEPSTPSWSDEARAEDDWEEGEEGEETSYSDADRDASIIYGVAPVIAALKSERRQVYELCTQDSMDLKKRKDGGLVVKAIQLAERAGATVTKVSKHDLNMMSNNRPHQGLVLKASRIDFINVSTLSIERKRTDTTSMYPVWIALDEVADPQNFGAILRSAYVLGAEGVVTCHRNSAPLSPAVSKASSGAMELMEVHSCHSMPRFLDQCQKDGWQVLGAAADDDAVDCAQFEVSGPTILVLGSEGKGLRPTVRRLCTQMLRVECPADTSLVDSLNVSVAAGILLHRLLSPSRGSNSSPHPQLLAQEHATV
eukprot:jgi/Chlat1/819/Chrsp104S01277